MLSLNNALPSRHKNKSPPNPDKTEIPTIFPVLLAETRWNVCDKNCQLACFAIKNPRDHYLEAASRSTTTSRATTASKRAPLRLPTDPLMSSFDQSKESQALPDTVGQQQQQQHYHHHQLQTGSKHEANFDPEVGAGPLASPPDDASCDLHVVGWDGPDDPQSPRNWTSGVKLMHVLLISAFTLYS